MILIWRLSNFLLIAKTNYLCAYVHRLMNALTQARAHTHTHTHARAHTHTHTHTHRVRMCTHLCILYSGLLFEKENLHELSHSKLLRGKIFQTVRSTY